MAAAEATKTQKTKQNVDIFILNTMNLVFSVKIIVFIHFFFNLEEELNKWSTNSTTAYKYNKNIMVFVGKAKTKYSSSNNNNNIYVYK